MESDLEKLIQVLNTFMESDDDALSLPSLEENIYHASPGLTASGLVLLNRSPAHFKAIYIDQLEKPETPAMRLGAAAHAAVLDPTSFELNYVSDEVMENQNRRTKAFKQELETWQKLNPGKTMLKAAEYELAKNIRESVYSNSFAKELLQHGSGEFSQYRKLEGFLCKARADYYRNDGVIVEVKTTSDARRDEFERKLYNMNYHLKAAWYNRIFEGADYFFIVVENTPPYGVMVYHACEAMVEAGKAKMVRSFQTYQQCARSGVWPGYQQTEVEEITLPSWAWSREESLEETGLVR